MPIIRPCESASRIGPSYCISTIHPEVSHQGNRAEGPRHATSVGHCQQYRPTVAQIVPDWHVTAACSPSPICSIPSVLHAHPK